MATGTLVAAKHCQMVVFGVELGEVELARGVAMFGAEASLHMLLVVLETLHFEQAFAEFAPIAGAVTLSLRKEFC